MGIFKNIFSREDKVEKEAQIRAVEGVLTNLYSELGLGEAQAINGDYRLILNRLADIGIGIQRLKTSYLSSRVIEMVRDGKRVPRWLQEAVKREIEIKQSQGEPEIVKP